MISVDGKLEELRAFLGAIPGAAERATASALNAAAEDGRAAAVRRILSRYAAKPGDVAAMITIRKATATQPAIEIRSRSRALSAGYFPHTPSAPGTGGPGRPPLTAEILRGSPKAIPGAFVANLSSGPRIMHRTGGKTARGKQAIASVYTVPLGAMLATSSVREAVEADTLAALDGHLEAAVARELDRAAREAGA